MKPAQAWPRPRRTGIVPVIFFPITLLRRRRRWRLLAVLAAFLLLVVEPYYHGKGSYTFKRPSLNTDPVFFEKCTDPQRQADMTERQSAALFMLARNMEGNSAARSIRELEERFNKWFHYPWVLLNDQPWEKRFQEKVLAAVSNGTKVHFDTIPRDMWGWPEHFGEKKQKKAMKTWDDMVKGMTPIFRDGTHTQKASYHHMCRFNSGFFYDHPALKKYKWYWRVEPGVSFTCDIPYDPFALMHHNDKVYGYTIALWEVGKVSPGLFRATADYADTMEGARPPLWDAMHEPSRAPWPIRRFIMPNFPSRNRHGDKWSMCHFWSNFEIANLDFFRSDEYRDYFSRLDEVGGFHSERWGDAPVHSLAAALFLQPEQLHYFQDIGYIHEPFQHCPSNYSVGCNCQCRKKEPAVNPYCLKSIRRTVEPDDRSEWSYWRGGW